MYMQVALEEISTDKTKSQNESYAILVILTVIPGVCWIEKTAVPSLRRDCCKD